MDKRNLLLTCGVVFLVFGIAFWSIKESNHYRNAIMQEQREEEEQQEQDLKKVYDEMDLCAKELSEILQKNGIEDIKVVWTQCTKEEYEETYGLAPSYCTYFFSLDYCSDQIANICDSYLNNGEEEALIALLRNCCKDKQSYALVDTERCRTVRLGEGAVNICINDGVYKDQILFKTSNDQEYFIDASDMGTWVYKNGKHIVNRQNRTPEYKHEEEEKSFYIPSYETNDHTAKKNKGPYYDPYGVEDYDNPDAFAEEMAEEFGDGDFDEGYTDAYSYWEEEY